MTGDVPTFADLAASVSRCGDLDRDSQLASRGYHDQTCRDVTGLSPVIAEHIIATYSCPGDIVLDPDCGAGATIVEALRQGRHAIGLTAAPYWWRLARANVTVVKASGAATDGMVLVLNRRAGTFASAHTAGLAGRVALVVTTLRPDSDHQPGWTAPFVPDAAAIARLGDLLARSRPLLRNGAHVVVAVAPFRRHGELVDLCGPIRSVAMRCGLAPIARTVALTARLTRGRIITHATLAQRRHRALAERQTGHPVCLPAHTTILVFRATQIAADDALAQPLPGQVSRRHRYAGQPQLDGVADRGAENVA